MYILDKGCSYVCLEKKNCPFAISIRKQITLKFVFWTDSVNDEYCSRGFESVSYYDP